ncbi:MAG: permease-like cell division protein FtsX [Clostridia bacterium]|nr:permease-like cell division protein FtsX [Clostridia bacterium]
MSKKSRNQSNRKAGFAYYVREGLTSVFVHGFTSLAAMLVIAACLMITGIFSLVAYNIDLQIRELEGKSEIVIYIDERVSRADAQALGARIKKLDNIKTAQFVTKEQLFEDYLESLGEDAYVMEELREDNPLRDSYQITMKDVGLHEETVEALEALDGVADSSSMQEVSDRLIQIRKVINLISVTLVTLLGAVSVFIIANTVKLAMFARKEEIAVMKMVGATNHFIRAPFVVEGMFLGMCAALLAFFVQWGVYAYVTKQLAEGTAILTMVSFTTVWQPVLGLMLCAGLILGVGGSVITIRRFLRV